MPKDQSGTRRETTEEQRANVIVLRAQGHSFDEVEAKTGILRPTAQRIVKRFEQRKTLENAAHQGKPPKLKARDLRKISRFVVTNPHATIADITADATLDAGRTTVKKALKKLRYRSCIPGKLSEAKGWWSGKSGA